MANGFQDAATLVRFPLTTFPATSTATSHYSSVDADSQLVERCIAGENAAWEELVRQHSGRVYAMCYRFTNSSSEAQDLSQEVFLRIFRSLSQFRSGKGAFTVWLTRLTRNLLIDHYRKSRRDRATDSLDERLPIMEETASSARTDGALSRRETDQLLQHALSKLSPELRETVILRDLQEMEYKEIAEALNVPEGTVKSRLNRGRAELARLLQRHRAAV